MKRLEGKIALVTGGGSGIGRRACERFVEEGATVAVADLDLAAAEETAAALGEQAFAVHVDVARGESARACVEAVLARFGRLDCLVNNAGVTIVGAVHELSEEQWDKEMDVNVKGVFLMSKVAWDALVETKGNIVNTASIAAHWAIPNDAAYCASKAAVMMLTKCLALDGATAGVRANSVCPGYIDTPMIQGYFDDQPDPQAARSFAEGMHPLGRLGAPGDIAEAMVYLASDQAGWVTGTALTVDGGLTSGVWG